MPMSKGHAHLSCIFDPAGSNCNEMFKKKCSKRQVRLWEGKKNGNVASQRMNFHLNYLNYMCKLILTQRRAKY